MSLRRSAGPLIAELRRRRRQSLRDRRRIAAAITFERYVKFVGRKTGVYCEPPTHEELVKSFGEAFAKAVSGLLGPTRIPNYEYITAVVTGNVKGTGVFKYSIDESGDKKNGETP